MKIIAGFEPTSGDTGELSYKIIEEVVATTSPGELVACLEKWMPVKFETLVHLLDWKDVFNKLDERLTNIMHTRRNELVLTDKESVVSEGTPTGDLETDVRELKTILKFTAQVLENSIFKDVYNSAEILVELLNAYDDELMALALQALVALAVAPQSHRCNLDMPESYSTALHQNQAYFDAIFELIDASYFVTDIPLQEFLSEDFVVTPEMRRVKVDLNTRSKYSKSLLTPDTRGEVVEVERFLLPENNFEIVDLAEDRTSLQEILTVQAANLTAGLKLSLLCAVRMRRLLLTPAGRQQLLRIQYQATSVLVGCYPEISVLYTFFQDKIELIKNFIYLLRTGPGSLDYQHNLLDLDIRVVACQSLEAIVGSHDHASYAAPIVVRYPWMLYDMGLNKGQYMGTLPCLIRSAMSYLLSLEAAGVMSEESMDVVGANSSSMALATRTIHSTEDMASRLLWIENIFILLSAVVNEVESAVSALNDNGLVGSILQMVSREHYTVKDVHFKYVECLVVEILEMTVTHHSPALVSFKEKNGLESVINRLYREIQMCLGDVTSTTSTTSDTTTATTTTLYQDHTSHVSIIPIECSILIQRLFTLIRSVQSIGGTDANNTQWYKLPALTHSLKLIFAHASKVGHLVLAPALSLLADIVGNDPAPPSILSYMISSGLGKEALIAVTNGAINSTNATSSSAATSATTNTNTITATTNTNTPAIHSTRVVFSEELMKALLDLISALSLTADGIALVNEISPFGTIFSVFYNTEYVFPRSRVIMNSLPNLVGAGLEELLRHYPAYATNVITELVDALKHITSLADTYISADNFNQQTGNLRFDAQYQNIVQFCTAFTLCLEPILLKRETVTGLHKRGGLALLIKVLRIALGPPRYVLDSFACMVDSTAGSIGYTPLIAMVVHRCFHQIAEVEAVELTEVLVAELSTAYTSLDGDLLSHAQRYAPRTSLRPCTVAQPDDHGAMNETSQCQSIVPVTIGGNANPLLEGLLDTVTRAPLQDYCENDHLSDKLLSFARIVRGFAYLDVLVESLGLVLANRTDERILSQCMSVLSAPAAWTTVSALINNFSVPTHLEMARARGLYVNSTKENCVKVHPVYHLTVIAAEYISVKEGPESNTTVCRLGRGTTIEAYERQTSGLGGVLKYRTKLGWVSVYKTFASNDPQVLVTAITKKCAEDAVEETARNVGVYDDPEKRSDFEKFANVSAKRGGFLALYHFNHTVKTHLLSVIGRHTFSKSATAGMMHESYSLTQDSAARVQVLMTCLKSLIPVVINPTPRSAFNAGALLDTTSATTSNSAATSSNNLSEAVEQSEPKTTRYKPLRARKDGPEDPRSRKTSAFNESENRRVDNNSLMFNSATNTVLKEQYFQQDEVPNMEVFPTSVVYLSLRLIELSQALFFDIRRNKMELNPLFLAHTVYDQNTLESILHVALKVFLCALPDTEIETVDNPAHRGMYLGEWYPLKESELDHDRPEDLSAEAKTDATNSTSSAVLEEKDSTMDVETSADGKVPSSQTESSSTSSADASSPPFKPFATYLAYRRALRERRLFAVSSVDNIIEWWKRLCSSLLPSVSSLERGLQRQVDKEHDLDIYGMKRYTVNLISKYLVQVWSHPQLHLLPPTTTKNVLDLMAVVVKTMHDLKSVQSLRTPAPAAASASSSSAALGALEPSARRTLGSARRINLGQQGANAALHAHLRALSNMNGGAAGAAPDFSVSEDTIRNVEEMGFTRRAITRAATLMQTNDVNSLVAYLLENPYVDEPDPPAAPAAAPAPTPAVAVAVAETPAGSGEGSSSAGATTGSSASSSAAAPVAAASASATSAGAAPAALETADDIFSRMLLMTQGGGFEAFPMGGRSRSNSAFPEPSETGKYCAALPLVATQTEAELKAEKDLLQRLLKCIYGDVPALCMRLIEKGPSKHLALLDAETRTRNAGITTEVNTVMVLNQMVRCLEKNPLPESLLKIVQLSWLYRRAIAIFKEGELNEEKFNGLFGLLHAIVVLLTCKVQSPSMGRAPATTNELHFLIFTLDDRYNELYPLMLSTLESFTSELSGSADGLSAAEASRVEWIGPAVLILDLISQPVLVEPETLRAYRVELESYGKPAGGEGTTLSADDSLLSEQVKSALDRLFFQKHSASNAALDELFGFSPFSMMGSKNRGSHSPMDIVLPRSGSSAFKLLNEKNTTSGAASATKESSTGAADTAPVPAEALPLFDEAVTLELKLRALKVGLSLLRLTANGKSANVNVPQAAMQLVAHLTRHPEARKEFHAQQGGVLVLRHRSSFAGMNSVVFTLLQQVLEDEKFLTQSMVTAIRLCLLRLSKQSSPHVLFKNFMEVISPVVFRQQALFMKVLKSHTHIKCMSGQNFISLRETPLVEDKNATAATATSVGTGAVAGAVTETALVPAESTSASESAAAAAPVEAPVVSVKKQRLADGSAVTTAVHSASKSSATTPGASQASTASGLKSGAKRVLHAAHHDAAHVPPHSAAKTPQHSASTVLSNNETVTEIVDELFTRIICKYLSIKTMDGEGNTKLTTDFVAADTSLTIAQMLIIAADLIASLPSFAINVHRYVFNLSKVPSWATEVAAAELPVKHALTGQTLGGLFVTFVIHALLLPSRMAYPAAADAATDSLPAAEAKTKKAARIAAVEKLAGAPGALRDACSYFLASLASRPGEGRRRVLNEVLNTANIGALVINTTEQFRALVAFSETILYLLNPPRKWASRDAFILPAKDILTSLAKQNAHTRLSAAICALDLSHPLALETSIVLAVPLDTIIRKGLEPAPLAATLLAGGVEPAVKPAAPRTASAGSRLARLPSSDRGAANSTAAVGTSASAAAAESTAGASTTTPSVRRATFASTVTDSAAAGAGAAGASQTSNASSSGIIGSTGAPLTAQSFVTPASNRRRGNTDQSLDAEERMLLLTSTEMHNAADQHDHLVRPAGAYDSDVDGSDDDFDEEEGEEDGHEVAEALGAGEAFHMHDEDDEDDEDDENEEGDDSGNDGSDDDEEGHGHGHHHMRHHVHRAHGSHSSDEDSQGDSGSDVTGEGDDDDEDDEDDDGEEDEDEDDHHGLDESGEFVEDDDEDDDMGDSQDGDSEVPDLEVAIELGSEDEESEGEGSENEGEEGEGDEEGEEGSHDGSEGDSQEGSHDGSEEEDMGMDDESEIEDDEVDLEDEQDVEHMLETNALVRRPRGRGQWRNATSSGVSQEEEGEEQEEHEDQGEGDDDDDEDSGDEEGDQDDAHEDGEEQEQDIADDFEGEHDGSYFAGEDGYISNGDAREENEDEGDLENQNHDDFWLEMNGAEEGGSASSSAPNARRISHGGLSAANAARSHVREFFTRARHNERGRARNSLGGGGHHTVTDITNMLREAAAAGGANVVSMGPLFTGGNGANGEEGGAVALHNRPFWMRGGERGEVNMEDRLGQISNSFSSFLGNMLPPNMTLSSSTARVDPRTGAVTLSFGGTQNPEAGDGASASRPMSALTAQTSGHQAAARPPTHPLLAVTDASRNRFLQPCPNSLTLGGNARALVRAFPGLANQTNQSGSTIDSSMRAGPVSERRNSVGPIVSDRRWGTDLGDLEPAGARLAALTTAVETALGDVIEREQPVSRTNILSGKSRTRSGGNGGDSYESDDNGDEDADNDSSGGFEDAFRAAAAARIRRQMGLSRQPAESKEEEGELQESKETEPEPRRSEPASSAASAASTSQAALTPTAEASQTSSNANNASENSTAITAADLAAAVSAHTAASEDSAMEVDNAASSTVAVSSASVAAPAPTDARTIEEPAEVNAENLAFVESLSDDVRDEVLLSVDEDFIRSLPARIQLEARALRESQEEAVPIVCVVPSDSSSANQSASSAAAAAAAAAPQPAAAAPAAAPSLPTDYSIDFSAIMDDLRTINSSNAPATAVAVIVPNAAATGAASTVAASANDVLRRLLAAAASGGSASSGASNDEGDSATNAGSESSATSNAVTTSAAGATASSSTTVVAPVGTPAPAAPTAEETRAAELQLTVSLAEDRADAVLPFGANLIARLLRSLFTTNKSKLPRSVLKLLSTACRYKQSRVWIIRALFGSLSHSGARVVDCVRKVPLESDVAATTAGIAAFEAEMTRLQSAVDLTATSALNFRRILCGISFLFRKTDKLVWFDIMLRPLLEEDSVWLFGSLINLLSNPVNASSINLEYLLQVMEELVSTFSKMTSKQANELAAAAQSRIDANRRSAGGAPTRRSVSYAHTPAASLDTIFEGVDENSSSHSKRRRLEDAETPVSESSSSGMNMSPPSRGRAASIDIESAAAEVAANAASSAASSSTALVTQPAKEESSKPLLLEEARHRMPFPVLVESEAKILCALAGSSECGGPARKRLMRVMRNLSLCDTNWMLFLDNLAVVGADLAARATMEFSNLHNTLVEVVQNNESAATAMARPELSAPKSLSEVRLLNVLRIMSALRTRNGAAAPAEAEVVASRMRRIQANGLWESLCDCLDIVRDLEGITDVAADEIEDKHHKSSSSSSNNQATKPEDKKVTLSSLTMRFMPLIECYLSVCATTMLVRPDNVSGSAMNESQKELERMSSGFKRRHSRDDSHLPVTVAGGSSANASSMRQSPSIASTPMHGGLHSELASPFNLNRVNSMLPGSRFRQHPAYFQMQMELNDEAAAERLVNFTSQNRVLFNNVLRNNVQLLESSFSPLVSVPKCRQLLHFDIKRAFFKMKLKRMRQSAARMHGALRLNVRRSRVFEESFQALRYKTADEMRRRLSVNFHGEEGMDAGGLTREWYGVLAREIFNPNYALFTSTGDNVTFQPNSQSHINPDHNSYFKFVGRVIGKAICDGHLLDAHFTRSFYKHILGMPVSVVDLEAIDPEYFKSLKQILATPLDLLGLDLTFSAEQNDFGKIKIIDLIPQGQDVPVTDDTKHEYVKLLAHHRMTTAIRTQIDSFLEGFHELVPPELISIFDAQELELLISGLPDIDLDDLRAHTEYHSYKATDPEIGYFWNVLKSFSKQEKALFLQFVTGTSKVPLDGFAALQGSDGIKQFNIHKAFGGSHLLPSAHTCFNQLDLPEYSSEEMLREKLLIAIREGSEGFGFA